MADVRFEWTAAKNAANQDKHGVSFEEAQSVFLDGNAIQFFDQPHSGKEDRFLMLGLSCHLRILLVSHTYREEDSVIRIISARDATARERQHYTRKKP